MAYITNQMSGGAGDGCGPDGTIGKGGGTTRFSEMAFRPRDTVKVSKGEMNSGENRCRIPELFRRANARVKSPARSRHPRHSA